ncbi:MAG: DUF2357 domain-containing protein [Thermofilaceae archaeon]
MNVSKVIFAEYDLTGKSGGEKEDTYKRGLTLSRSHNEELIKRLKESEKLICSENVTSCEKCQKNECHIFFNNYTGLFMYKHKNEQEQVLVIHKKLCKLINKSNDKVKEKCENECGSCTEISDSIEVKKIVDNYSLFFEKFALKIIESLSIQAPFQFISPVSAYIKETGFTENIEFKLLLLYQKRDEIRSSISHILSNPHRKTIEVNRLCRYDEVTYIDSDVILDIIQNPHRFIADKNGCIEFKNERYSPYQVMQYSIEESFDTLENRYIKNLLINLIEMIKKCIVYIENKFETCRSKNEGIYVQIYEELNNLKYEIETALRHFFFSEVGELTYFPSNSQVLMKQAGYRELFILDRLLRATILPTFISGLEEAFNLRRMDILWELFVMTKILEALKKLGFTIKEKNWEERVIKDTIYDYASFTLNKGNKEVKVLYQESIPLSKKGANTLRPDFILESPDDKRKMVIDAKFMFKENVPTDELAQKYLTCKEQRFSDGVFAACLADFDTDDEKIINVEKIKADFDSDDEKIKSVKKIKAFNFTHMFNESLYIEFKNLDDLIKYFLKIEEHKDIKYDQQYLGYMAIILPLKEQSG